LEVPEYSVGCTDSTYKAGNGMHCYAVALSGAFSCVRQLGSWVHNRDRGTPHVATPPTPPCVRIRYTAIRLIESIFLCVHQAGQAEAAEIARRKCDPQSPALAHRPWAVRRPGCVPCQVTRYTTTAQFLDRFVCPTASRRSTAGDGGSTSPDPRAGSGLPRSRSTLASEETSAPEAAEAACEVQRGAPSRSDVSSHSPRAHQGTVRGFGATGLLLCPLLTCADRSAALAEPGARGSPH